MADRLPLEALRAFIGRKIQARSATGGAPLPPWTLVEAEPVPEWSRAPRGAGDCYVLLFRVEAPLPQGGYVLDLPDGAGSMSAFAAPVLAGIPGAHMEAVFN